MAAIQLPENHTFVPNPDKKFWQEQCIECGLNKSVECHTPQKFCSCGNPTYHTRTSLPNATKWCNDCGLPQEQGKCKCDEMSCDTDCVKRHTHKGFSCEKCHTQQDAPKCEVEKKTGGHYFTEGGSRMCCEAKQDATGWEAEFTGHGAFVASYFMSEGAKKTVVEFFRTVEQEAYERGIEKEREAHDAKDGYCCACDYDIAGFEEALTAQKTRLVAGLERLKLPVMRTKFGDIYDSALDAAIAIIKETK